MKNNNFLFSIIKSLLALVFIFLLLKGITLLPLQKIHPNIADKLVFLQEFERNIEKNIENAFLTFQTITYQREIDRNYELLYRELITRKMLDKALLFENQELRQALRFWQNNTGKLIPAEIIARSADNWFNYVVVNKGRKQGVRPNMAVINEFGLVGFAYQVSEQSTRVILLTDPQFQVSCINERTKEINIVAGRLYRPLEVKYVTLHSDVQPGDKLLTSGYSYRFKKGIPVAEVVKVELPRNKLFKKVEARPLADVSKLDVVFFLE